jgi:ferredoxin--NADP+ reductase
MNRLCGQETAKSVITDFAEGRLPEPAESRDGVADLVAGRGAGRINGAGWKNIDRVERSAGVEVGRRRVKLVTIKELEAAALD